MGTMMALKAPRKGHTGSGDIASAAAHTRVDEATAPTIPIDWDYYRRAVAFHGVDHGADVATQLRQLRNAVYAAILSANCPLELNAAGYQAIKDRDLSYPGMDAAQAGAVLASYIVTHSADYFVTASMGESLVRASRIIADYGAGCLWTVGSAADYRQWLVKTFRGLADKTASFAMLLAYPLDCDLAIIDRWVLGWLNFRPVKRDGTLRKRNDPTHTEYLALEQRVRRCYDLSRALGNTPQDMPLGMFHWAIWDFSRGHADPHFTLSCR